MTLRTRACGDPLESRCISCSSFPAPRCRRARNEFTSPRPTICDSSGCEPKSLECKLGAQFHLALDVGESQCFCCSRTELTAAGPAQVVTTSPEASRFVFGFSRVMSRPSPRSSGYAFGSPGKAGHSVHTSWNTSSAALLSSYLRPLVSYKQESQSADIVELTKV